MGARIKRIERLAMNPKPPSRKYAQPMDRDGPPLGDLVTSGIFIRFTHDHRDLEVVAADDNDMRKARTVNGVLTKAICPPNGRQQSLKKTGVKEEPHEIIQGEAREEVGINSPLNELFPVLVTRRVGRGKTGRDSFDREFTDENRIVHYDHFVFAMYADRVEPRDTQSEDTAHPRWFLVGDVLGGKFPAWSFDHITLLVATLKIIGELSDRWSRGEWKPEEPRTRTEEAVGSIFFPRLAEPLKNSPEALSTLLKFKNVNFNSAVAERMEGAPEEREGRAAWYLGQKRTPGRFVKMRDNLELFRTLGSASEYFRVLREIEKEKEARR